MKTCKECKKEKTLDDFHKHKDCKGGRRTVCKECVAKRVVKNKRKNKSGECTFCQEIIVEKSPSTVYMCKPCYKKKYEDSYAMRKVFRRERGSITDHKRKTIYFVKKILMNDYMVSMEDINTIITLFQHTFLTTGFDMKYMFEKLEKKILEWDEYNKKIIDLTKNK